MPAEIDQKPYIFPSHGRFTEPSLIFHPERREDCSVHPLEGLAQFGPYSRSLLHGVLDPIRIAAIVPHGYLPKLDNLLQEFRVQHKPQERRAYLPPFPGFSAVFGLRLVAGNDNVRVQLPPELDEKIASAQIPHAMLAEAISKALAVLAGQRSAFDVVLVVLPTKWARCYGNSETDDFDLHHYIKAQSASLNIPVQVVREDKALQYPCRCSVMWRLSIALYCKAGGIPWKLADSSHDVAYIGLSYALRPPQTHGPKFVTCCSQVFDEDGAGLEFLVYETSEVRIDRDNPYLSRAEMRRVMARSLMLYQKRHAGKSPRKLIVHKSTEFKSDEIDGCFDVWPLSDGLELLQIQDTGWRAIKIDAPVEGESKGRAAAYPLERGTYQQVGENEVLLWTQGICSELTRARNYFKEGKGIPRPLLVRRHAGHGGWHDPCWSVLALSKMNWNNDGLYDRLPVTLGYATVLAQVIKRMPTLAAIPYHLRFFM